MKNELSLLKKENKLREQYLPEEEQEMIRRMLRYMTSKRIEVFDVEVTHKELIGMALGAMKQGETLRDIIGKDEKSFCDEVIANSRMITVKDSIVRTLGRWVLYYGIIIVTKLVLLDVTREVSFGASELIMLPLWSLIWASIPNFISDNYIYEKGIKKQIPTIVFSMIFKVYLKLSSFFTAAPILELNRWLVTAVVIIGAILAKIIYDRYIHHMAEDYHWQD